MPEKTFDMIKKKHVCTFQIDIFCFEIRPGTPLNLRKATNFSEEKRLKSSQWLQKNINQFVSINPDYGK